MPPRCPGLGLRTRPHLSGLPRGQSIPSGPPPPASALLLPEPLPQCHQLGPGLPPSPHLWSPPTLGQWGPLPVWCLQAQPYPLPRHGFPSSPAPVALASLQQLPQGNPLPLSFWCILQPSQLPAPLQPWTAYTPSSRL